MAYKIVWTKQAIKGYDKIIDYLLENWSDREVTNFIIATDKFFEVLIQHPEILEKTTKHKNIYRGANQ